MTEGLHFCQLKGGNVVNYDELGQLIGLSSLAGHRSSILKAHFKDIVRAIIIIILLPFTKTFFLNLKTTLLSLIFYVHTFVELIWCNIICFCNTLTFLQCILKCIKENNAHKNCYRKEFLCRWKSWEDGMQVLKHIKYKTLMI